MLHKRLQTTLHRKSPLYCRLSVYFGLVNFFIITRCCKCRTNVIQISPTLHKKNAGPPLSKKTRFYGTITEVYKSIPIFPCRTPHKLKWIIIKRCHGVNAYKKLHRCLIRGSWIFSKKGHFIISSKILSKAAIECCYVKSLLLRNSGWKL